MNRVILASCLCVGMLIGCTACETILEEDYYQLPKPKVVVNSVFAADTTWRVYLTLTKNVSDTQPFMPVGPEANVQILDEHGLPVEILKFYDRICLCYLGQTSPVEDKAYSVEISLPDQPLLQATSEVPSVVPIVDVEVDSISYEFDETVFMTIRFNDPGSKPNFYHVKILKYITSTYGDEAVPITPLDPSLINDYSSGRDLFLRDTHFDGQAFELELKVTRSAYPTVKSPFRVVLESVSNEYYYYFTSKNLQLNSRNDPFAQPIEIANNVKNGVGVFAGLSVSEHVIEN